MAMISERTTLMLGILGGLLAGAGLVVYTVAPQHTVAIAVSEGLAMTCLAVFLVTHFEMFREFSTRRSTRLGFNSLVMVALFATILGILNFLAARHSTRWDFSETTRFTLSPQTARLLRTLPREVKATVFANDQSPALQTYRDLFESYTSHTAKLTVEFVDPEKKPGIARRYAITRLDTAVLESGKQETRITTPSEQELTNALVRVTKDEKKHLYFLTGHAERLLEDTDKQGYSFLKEALERQGYSARSLSLYESKQVPLDTSVLVMAGPLRPVAAEEQALIAGYVNGGGRLIVLWDPGSRAGIEGLLAGWGLQSDNRTVLDTQTILGGDLTMPVVNSYGPHEITQDMAKAFTMFPHARPLTYKDQKSTAWQYYPLAKSSLRSWGHPGDVEKGRDFDPAQDTPGPLVLAVLASTQPKPTAENTAAETAKDLKHPAVLVVGDSDFASNAYLDFAGNSDFLLHAVAWLAEEKGQITIPPKDIGFGTFLLTTSQSNALFALQVIGLPGFLLATGFSVWRRRRRL